MFIILPCQDQRNAGAQTAGLMHRQLKLTPFLGKALKIETNDINKEDAE
jgi:hypothetical protein